MVGRVRPRSIDDAYAAIQSKELLCRLALSPDAGSSAGSPSYGARLPIFAATPHFKAARFELEPKSLVTGLTRNTTSIIDLAVLCCQVNQGRSARGRSDIERRNRLFSPSYIPKTTLRRVVLKRSIE